jgi:uncharacterized protein (TIGR02246 family)
MIRLLQPLVIGTALLGALSLASFGERSSEQQALPEKAQPTRASSAAGEAENAVRQAVDAYIAAYNQKDAAKLAALFTADATLVDSENTETRGREAIAQQFNEGFAERSGYTLEAKIDRVRLITPDAAQADGVSRLVAPREATIATQFVILLARQNNAWKIVEIRDYRALVETITPYERLKELEWMVGEWVDESEGVQITSSVRWGEGKGFLIRDYSVQIKGEPTTSGLIIMAWDPQTDQIKSWIFNSDGGRGEASWTRATENQWVVKAHGSTGDGLPTSATQLISLVNKDAIRTSSTDRVVGGEIARDIEDVIMVRKPPPPGSKPASAKSATGSPPASGR